MKDINNTLEEFKKSGYFDVLQMINSEENESFRKDVAAQIEDYGNLTDISEIVEIILKWKVSIVKLWKFLDSKKAYEDLLRYVYDDVKAGFEYKILRTCPIYYRMEEGGKLHVLEIRHFLTNLMLWRAFVEFNDPIIEEDDIFDFKKVSTVSIQRYLNERIIIPYRDSITFKKLNILLHDILYDLATISRDFNEILGISINTESFIQLAERNPEFNEIIRTKIPSDMQPSEVEAKLDELTNRQKEILMTEDNVLKPMLCAGSGVKDKQRCEFLINGGFKPDLSGKTIPIVINSNFLVGGLSNLIHYYIDTIGGRKSLLMNKKEMGRSGWFARKVNEASLGIKIDEDPDSDCGSLTPIMISIDSQKHLLKLVGRWYRPLYSREYSMIKPTDTQLIGTTILLRSPVTCNNKKICHKCYGNTAQLNSDLNSAGTYGTTKISEPLSQSILSTKHQLSTDSVTITFDNPLFDKFFKIYGNNITLTNEEDLDLTKYELVIIKENMEVLAEFEDSEFNEFTPIFHIRNLETEEIYDFFDRDGKDLFLTNELKAKLIKNNESKCMEVRLSDIEALTDLFVVEIDNNELTKPLYDIMHLVGYKNHDGYETIDSISQRMLELLIEAGIPAKYVHAEMMIYPLIRDAENILKRPKFNKHLGVHDYIILSLDKALSENPSVTISLSSHSLKRQFKNPLTFKKFESSPLDPFYKE